MKHAGKIIGIIIMCILFSNCNKNDEGVAIYILENYKDIKISDLSPKKIDLPKEPLINQSDIEEYIWNKHVIILKKEAWQRLKKLKSEKYSFHGIPFVLTVNRTPKYIGFFYSEFSSIKLPRNNIIIAENGIENNHISILFEADYHNFNDPRENPQIYRCLKKANLL